MLTADDAEVFARTAALRSSLAGAEPLSLKPLTFTLTITLGNDAMSTPANVCDALSDVIDRVDFYSEFPAIGVEGTIGDANGNTVGSWAVN